MIPAKISDRLEECMESSNNLKDLAIYIADSFEPFSEENDVAVANWNGRHVCVRDYSKSPSFFLFVTSKMSLQIQTKKFKDET